MIEWVGTLTLRRRHYNTTDMTLWVKRKLFGFQEKQDISKQSDAICSAIINSIKQPQSISGIEIVRLFYKIKLNLKTISK